VVTRRALLGAPLVFSLRAQSKLDQARVDAIAQEELAAQAIPGLAIAVLLNGETYTQGYGVRGLKDRRPITPRTIFATGSVTKSFTALAAAMLVEEGKLDWDHPAREYLPWFRLYDPLATAQINVRDMLCHRSGLPRYDFLRFGMMLDRTELIRRLQYLPPTAGFRAKWQYNNLMYCAAGLIEAHLSGMAWEDLIERRIFGLLGMGDSNVRVAQTRESNDFALPHEVSGGKLAEAEFYDYQKFGVGPNGAVNSTANDLVKYLRFHLAGGPLFEQLHDPQMVVDRASTYGLGWWIDNADGTLSHSGSITGFRAFALLGRQRKFALAVLANGPANTARIAYRLREAITGQSVPTAAPNPTRAATPKPPPLPPAPPTQPLRAFTGRYEHPAFGSCDVTNSGNRLTLRFPVYSSALTHVRADQFRTKDSREVEFAAPAEMSFRAEPAAPMFKFVRTL
jgi:CubicO group peptidase (beta-lactamase class C family)